MTRQQIAAAAAVVCALLALFVLCDRRLSEYARQDAAHAARRCALLLSVAPTASDSLSVLQGTSWRIGCAGALTADTTQAIAR